MKNLGSLLMTSKKCQLPKMYDEIKEILDLLARRLPYAVAPELAYMTAIITPQECKILLDYITNLQEENERLKELYRRTYNHLFDIGNDELARYFQAQIGRCPTFTPQGEDNE